MCDDSVPFTKLFTQKVLDIAAQQGWEDSVRIFHSPYALLHHMELPQGDGKRLCFLDIEMPELSGFAVAKRMALEETPMPIVFVSARNELVFQSLIYRPVYFLRKNFLDTELEPLLKRLHKEFGQALHHVQVTSGKQVLELIPEKIAYAEAQRNYVLLHTKQSHQRLRMKLEDLEKLFLPYDFMRVHKSYLVNRVFIQQLRQKQLLLTTGQAVDIGKKWENSVRLQLCSPL